jgi:hypothetical protein
MHENCSIEILLNTDYSSKNIYTILQAGQNKNFIYRDQNNDYKLIPNTQHASEIIMKAQHEKSGLGPGVFVTLSGYSSIVFWFYQENEKLSFRVGVFSESKLKDNLIDLGYYVPLFLSLCEDFSILKIEAKFF